MTSLTQLETCTGELTSAVDFLISRSRDIDTSTGSEAGHPIEPLMPCGGSIKAHQARDCILTNITKVQTLLSEPADILQCLTVHVSPSVAILLFES